MREEKGHGTFMTFERLEKKPNIILISIDSLRADHMSCLGYHRKTTPYIDDITKKGVLFSQAIANGHNTAISFLSILTSTYPLMYQDTSVYPHSKSISMQRQLISEVLRNHDNKTAAITSATFFYPRYMDITADPVRSKIVLF